MNKTDKNQIGINGIIERARDYNIEIGTYVEHFAADERPSFLARLSNGRIEVPMDMADVQETTPSAISEKSIQKVASSFENENLIPINYVEKSTIKKTGI